VTATTTFARIFLAIVGFALVAAGVLYGILGLWGVDRGSPDAWILALLGLLGAAIGAGLLLWALKRHRRANP
jgi:xanthosine utilization system XapX-like protein